MKKTLLWIFYGLLGLFLIFVGGGFVLPGEVQIQRSVVIAAPSAEIFAIVSDLSRNKDWSPWLADAPNMKTEIKSQTIDSQLETAIDFGDRGKATTIMQLSSETGGTRVIWQFSARPNNFLERWISIGLDPVIGADLEKGLSNLKTYVEKS